MRRLARHLVLASLILGCGGSIVHAETGVLTNIAAIQSLNSSELAEARPVRLTAILVDRSDPWEHAVVVTDGTGWLYALADTNLFAPFGPTALLELTGVTDPGEFSPIIKVSGARLLGTTVLPEPRPANFYQLLNGDLDCQLVEVSGVVRACWPLPGRAVMRSLLAVDGGLVNVILWEQPGEDFAVDARVRLQAICLYQFNQKRQFLKPVLSVFRGRQIIIETPAPAAPFDAPVISSGNLRRYSKGKTSGHRVHVRGVVTHSQTGAAIWMRDATSGLRLQTSSSVSLQPGDLIDALGFPEFDAATPTLSETDFRKIGTTNPPAAIPLSHSADAFDYEDNLVTLDATLAVVTPVLDGLALSLRLDGTEFMAFLKSEAQGAARLSDWQPGSKMRVSGMCSVDYNEMNPVMGIWHPKSFQLLLRSPDDLQVLAAPSWWTLKHLAVLLGVVAGGLLLSTGLVTWLARRRLREQEQQRALAEAEFAAILAERNRMAREIHDTLAHGLTAISFRLRAAKCHADGAGEQLNQQLDAAQEEVRNNLAEARNSIWNMRAHVLENTDLPGALRQILEHMAEGPNCQASLAVTGQSRRLAPVVENNVLRAGQEAITNAFRHAKAGKIIVQLDFNEKELRLVVTDDGRGFDVAHPPKRNGGFGLVGMAERARDMNGKFEIRSAPEAGTQVLLTVPL